MKNYFYVAILCGLFLVLTNGFFLAHSQDQHVLRDNSEIIREGRLRTKKIMAQEKVLRQARRLVKQGEFDSAIAKLEIALEPEYLNREQDKLQPSFQLMKIYQLQGQFNLALQEADKIILIKPNHLYALEHRSEIKAQIQAINTVSAEPLVVWIDAYFAKYVKDIPPHSYNSFSPAPVGVIIRLYDYIGDYSNGMAFVDRILAYKKLRRPVRAEYEKVKQAFLQDQAEGKKGCLGQVSGQVCVGRATQLLIQSDVLSW